MHPSRVLLVAASVHTCNDAMFAVMYPLLPLMAVDLGLSYAEVGLVKALYSGASGILQFPAGVMAERWGEYALLAFGNGWGAAGLLGIATATTFPILLVLAILAGLGGNFQHPCASTMVARAFEGGRRGTAIGTLNFAGDLGKMAAPALVGLIALPFGWRAALLALGIFGIVFSVGVWLLKPWVNPPPFEPAPAPEPVATPETCDVRRVDGARATRTSTLAPPVSHRAAGLLPALAGRLDGRQHALGRPDVPAVRAGAPGPRRRRHRLRIRRAVRRRGARQAAVRPARRPLRAVRGHCADRDDDGAGPLGLVWGPSSAVLPLAVVFGFGLNGTSSVLYAAVASLVPDGKRGRGYGLYYTVIDVAAALMTAAYGLYADWSGLDLTFAVMALLTLAVIPLSIPLRARLAEAA